MDEQKLEGNRQVKQTTKSKAPDTEDGPAFPTEVASRAASRTQHAEAKTAEPHRTLHLVYHQEESGHAKTTWGSNLNQWMRYLLKKRPESLNSHRKETFVSPFIVA